MKGFRFVTPVIALVSLLAVGCGPKSDAAHGRSQSSGQEGLSCDRDNGGLTLPDGFCAMIVVDGAGSARQIAVRDNGDVYIALSQPWRGGTIVALRDRDGNGRADSASFFGAQAGTGIHIRGNYLYFASDMLIERYPLAKGQLLPVGPPDTVVSGFPSQRIHATKPFEFDGEGNMYVNVGAPSNACQDPPLTPGAAGLDPCPLLEQHGGVWEFKADSIGQTFEKDGHRYATGIRNGVANGWNPFTKKLYVAQHGRDQLHALWPKLYSDSLSAELPAEELFEVDDGDNFGWPYCYYDQLQGKKVLAPEYGGDGKKVGRCSQFEDPVAAYPGHWAPDDIVFYGGNQFPEHYKHGAFIAFHGSWNRSPLPQQGYNVVFQPFANGKPSGDYEVFADGFAGLGVTESSRASRFRPVGLAVGPDGSLYVADSQKGRIWRILYNR